MSQVTARLRRLILALENALLTFMLSAMVLLAGAQILMRNLWHTGITWGDPVLRVLVLWLALLGAMVATRESNHIRIDILSRYLPERLKRAVEHLTNLFAALVCGLLAWHSARFVYFEWLDGNLLFGNVPAWCCELILPLGFGVMALRFMLAGLTRQREPHRQ